tara:strand:- start:24 stop:1322 length:1299 start_codon:yes stop_codon:yes gene_type:complete
MANINFPSNPAGQTPANTFSPTSTPSSTSNGTTYTYDGTKWVGSSSGGGGGGSQDLQSVTDEGNTTTNGATFAGDILSGDFSPYGTKIKGINGITIRTDSSSVREVFGIYDEDNSTKKVDILADGTATFAGGNLTITDDGRLNSTEVNTYGTAGFIANGTSNTALDWAWRGSFGGANTSSIDYTGNASFAGKTSIGALSLGSATATGFLFMPQGLQYVQRPASSPAEPVYSAYKGTVNTINFNCDGTATFDSTVSSRGAFVARGFDPANYIFQGLEQSGTEVIRMNNNGSAVFNGTVTATVVPPSDARFKENITSAKPQLADVVALGGLLKNYDWNDDAPLNKELRSVRQLGLIAQEVEEVCPSIVKDINATKTMEITPAVTGPKGRVITEAVTEQVDNSYKGLSQEALIMKLIGAVAELTAKVEALEASAN